MHIKLEADSNKAKIIKRGQGAVKVDMQFEEETQQAVIAQY